MFNYIFSRDGFLKEFVLCNSKNFIKYFNIICLFLILTIIGCGPTLKQASLSDSAVKAEGEKQREIAFDTLIKREKRLYKVAFPLLASAASMNIDHVKLTCGFTFSTNDGYPEEYQEVARRYFNFNDNPVISYVHPQSPAAKAGIKTGDFLVNYNGTLLTGKSFREIVNIIKKTSQDNGKPISVVVKRNGKIVKIQVDPISCCKYNVVLINDDQINALSDGKNIAVTTGLMRVVENDDELAFVMAHEIAHNVLKHIRKKRRHTILGTVIDIAVAATTGVYTNTFSTLGRAAFSKGFEFEADYAGLYIAARAGHDIRGATNFWRRLAAEHPKAIEKGFGASHPSTPERFVAMENTIQEIIEKQRLGKPLIPERKQIRSGHETGSLDEREESPSE